MRSPEKNHLRQFLLFVFALLIPCFALWSSLSARLISPVIGMANLILSSWLPDIVNMVYLQGNDAVLMTRFDQINGQLVPIDIPNAGLGFMTDPRIISYSIPFYAALHFATEKRDYLANFLWGLLIIYPFILLSLICIFLKDLMVSFGKTFLDQPGVPDPNLIGVAYQMSVLIVPTLVPMLIWAWQSRKTPLLRDLFKLPASGMDDSSGQP